MKFFFYLPKLIANQCTSKLPQSVTSTMEKGLLFSIQCDLMLRPI